MKSIREAVINQNWDAVELMINAYSEDKGMYSKIAKNELELISDETVDRKVKKVLLGRTTVQVETLLLK